MKPRVFESQVRLPLPRSEVFPFFADPRNLEALTPKWLRFEILTPGELRSEAGALIDYRLRLHGIPFRWRTLISVWEPPFRFIDEQVKGPFRLWRHEHRFMEEDGVTCCLDRVEYAALGGPLVEKLFVERDVRRIFAHRAMALQKALGLFKLPLGSTAA
jgi:ligand-binding SRPBCC domain-containing protein